MATPEKKESSILREESPQRFFLTQAADRYQLTAAGMPLDNGQGALSQP